MPGCKLIGPRLVLKTLYIFYVALYISMYMLIVSLRLLVWLCYHLLTRQEDQKHQLCWPNTHMYRIAVVYIVTKNSSDRKSSDTYFNEQ